MQVISRGPVGDIGHLVLCFDLCPVHLSLILLRSSSFPFLACYWPKHFFISSSMIVRFACCRVCNTVQSQSPIVVLYSLSSCITCRYTRNSDQQIRPTPSILWRLALSYASQRIIVVLALSLRSHPNYKVDEMFAKIIECSSFLLPHLPPYSDVLWLLIHLTGDRWAANQRKHRRRSVKVTTSITIGSLRSDPRSLSKRLETMRQRLY